jgi:hypothetical protein
LYVFVGAEFGCSLSELLGHFDRVGNKIDSHSNSPFVK